MLSLLCSLFHLHPPPAPRSGPYAPQCLSLAEEEVVGCSGLSEMSATASPDDVVTKIALSLWDACLPVTFPGGTNKGEMGTGEGRRSQGYEFILWLVGNTGQIARWLSEAGGARTNYGTKGSCDDTCGDKRGLRKIIKVTLSLWNYFLYQFYGIYKYDQAALDFIQTCKGTQLSLCTVGKICPKMTTWKSCTNSLPLGIQAAPLYSLIGNIDFWALFLPICKCLHASSLWIFLDAMSIFLPSASTAFASHLPFQLLQSTSREIGLAQICFIDITTSNSFRPVNGFIISQGHL